MAPPRSVVDRGGRCSLLSGTRLRRHQEGRNMAGIPSTSAPPKSSPTASPNPFAAPMTAPSSAGGQPSYLVPLSVLTTLFFMWGGLTSLNDVLIPHLKGIFSLNYAQAMAVQLTFFGAYGIMSIPAGAF